MTELGDLIDAAQSVDEELDYLKTINAELSRLPCDVHYVLGNHCVTTLNKDEFLGAVGQPDSFGLFDVNGYHFVYLDNCFPADGKPYGRNNFHWTDANIPQQQLDWLMQDLESTRSRVIVMVHQRLDVTKNHSVKNARRSDRYWRPPETSLRFSKGIATKTATRRSMAFTIASSPLWWMVPEQKTAGTLLWMCFPTVI